jgi:hypothetical protein
MKRPARYVFALCSVISLPLCLTVCALWVRSYWVGDGCVWKPATDADTYYSTYLARGRWRFDRGHWRTHEADFYRDVSAPDYIEADAGALGFAVEFLTDDTPERHLRTVFPMWAPAALSAVLPAIGLTSYARRRRTLTRRAAGLCPACGYDLRASPARCPECGIVSATRRGD